MALDEVHQLFLQSCMSRRAFSEKTGQTVYAHCWKVCKGTDANVQNSGAPSYADLVDEINTNIEAFGFHIKRFLDEYSGKPWTAFVNTRSDDLAKVATEYSPQEIAYFRKVIRLIMKSGDRYSISSNVAKSAGKTVRPELKLTEAEKVLRTFVAKGWLVASSVKVGDKTMEMYQLSSRARMELEHYLAEEFPDQMDKAFECKVCNEIVMKGSQCRNGDCNMRMHDFCARTYFARNEKACPRCETPWDIERARPIGPDAAEGAGAADSSDSEPEGDKEVDITNDGDSGSEAPSGTASKAFKAKGKTKDKGKGKARGETTTIVEENTNDMDVEQDDEPSRATRRGSGRGAASQQDRLGNESDEDRKILPMVTQMEEDEEEEGEQDELEDDDDPIAARHAAKKHKEQAKKRKATSQSGR